MRVVDWVGVGGGGCEVVFGWGASVERGDGVG